MAELKTQPTDANVNDFLNTIDDEQKRQECFAILKLLRQTTHMEPRMWGDSIVGFGSYHYKYASGREGDWFLTGFSPRKQNITIYIMSGFDMYPALMDQLGKYKTSQSCLYIKKLGDIDLGVLKTLVQQSVEHMIRTNPPG